MGLRKDIRKMAEKCCVWKSRSRAIGPACKTGETSGGDGGSGQPGGWSSFFQSAESLERIKKADSGLVAAYEKQADRLAKELQGSEQGAQEAQPDLEEGSWGMVQEEMRGYRSYLDADGARRQEVKRQKRRLKEMKRWLQKQPGKGKEIQDYIDDWEPDDEDDELDEEALWAPVLTITAGFQKDGRFRLRQSGDKKKMNAGSSQPPVGDGSAESLCAGGNCDFRKLDFDRGISVGIVCRRRERKRGTAGDVWTAGLERLFLDAYAAHFLPGSGRKRREVSIMSRNIFYREMRRSGKI